MHLPEGYILLNRYRIEKVLGQGGFGKTYKVFDQALNHHYCIKELFVSGSSTRGANYTVNSESVGEISFAEFKAKFIREAQELARFNHPGIVKVVNVFEANNTAYYVMEYIEGETLKHRVERTGPLPRAESITVMQQLLDAVEAVHNAGKLHRDIKPDNVLVTPAGKVVLIDFGSARQFSDGKTLTQTALITPGYAPLEQYSERASRTTASDIYALGATLYFLLTGHRPLPATDRVGEVLAAPHEVNGRVDSQISSAVMLAMQMRAEDRFQQVSDLRSALNVLSQMGQGAPRRGETPAPPPSTGRRRRKVRVAVLVAFAVLLLGAAGVYLLKTSASFQYETVYVSGGTFTMGCTSEQSDCDTIRNEMDSQALEDLYIVAQGKGYRKSIDDFQILLSQDEAVFNDMYEYAKSQGYRKSTTDFAVLIGVKKRNDEKLAHQVTVSSFQMGKYEVTQAQWRAVMESNPSHFSGCDDCPVENVSWNDIQDFIRELNQQTGKNYRLPTEAEWEYAARGGNKSKGYKYAGGNNLNSVAWYDDNSGSKTHPVGQKQANELGIYDMSGNVMEWCEDGYGDYSSSAQTNPKGPQNGSRRVLRGGSWFSGAELCRVSGRRNRDPVNRGSINGFRLVLP